MEQSPFRRGVLEGIRTPDPLVRRGIQHVLFVVIKCCFALFKTEVNGCIQAKFNDLCLPVPLQCNQCYFIKKFILLEKCQKVRQHFYDRSKSCNRCSNRQYNLNIEIACRVCCRTQRLSRCVSIRTRPNGKKSAFSLLSVLKYVSIPATFRPEKSRFFIRFRSKIYFNTAVA